VGSGVTGFEEVGYVLVEPEAGPTVSGDWVAIFGNGYESKSCRAQLFVVNVETGALIKKIDTGVGSGNCTDKANTNRNGLGGVRVVRDSNKQIIGAYAGDLQGNMWKFDLSAASSTNWKVDLGGVPLFTAGSSKSITAAPSVIGLTASSNPSGGYMVAMGTGKFFEVDDITSTSVQSLYGIWDPVPFGTSVSTTALTNTSRLVQQTIGAGTTTSTGTYFTVSSTAVDYTAAVPNRGWYINLPNSGQRMVYPFEVVRSRFLIADTISPANVSLDPCAQNSAGTGYLYAIDALTGAGIQQPIFDTNGDGNIDSNDAIASGIQTSADGRNRTIGGSNTSSGGGSGRVDDGSGTGSVSYEDANKYICQAGSPACLKTKFDCAIDGSCAPTTVPGAAVIDTREWRQLFMR
jgi:type IV pilus assembly protein PilY1